jgi:hypothetical protein
MKLWSALALVPSIAGARDVFRWAGRVANLNTPTQEPLFLESGVVIGDTEKPMSSRKRLCSKDAWMSS